MRSNFLIVLATLCIVSLLVVEYSFLVPKMVTPVKELESSFNHTLLRNPVACIIHLSSL